ncbi:MAG: hypothetical protein ACPGVG_17590 [Mycobacterium sp.]
MGTCSRCKRWISLPWKGMCDKCLNAIGILRHRKRKKSTKDVRKERGSQGDPYRFVAPWVDHLQRWGRVARRSRESYERKHGPLTPLTRR